MVPIKASNSDKHLINAVDREIGIFVNFWEPSCDCLIIGKGM